MDWYEVTGNYHQRTFMHDCRLSSFPQVWQRELAALWRLEADVNNGGYLQFVANWGRESYVYACQALKRIGATRMADIVDKCQALVDEHFAAEGKTDAERKGLLPNQIINCEGAVAKHAGSVLPESVVDRLYELSYEFMAYPDDIAQLGLGYYRSHIEGDDPQ